MDLPTFVFESVKHYLWTTTRSEGTRSITGAPDTAGSAARLAVDTAMTIADGLPVFLYLLSATVCLPMAETW